MSCGSGKARKEDHPGLRRENGRNRGGSNPLSMPKKSGDKAVRSRRLFERIVKLWKVLNRGGRHRKKYKRAAPRKREREKERINPQIRSAPGFGRPPGSKEPDRASRVEPTSLWITKTRSRFSGSALFTVCPRLGLPTGVDEGGASLSV
jgi:hypothetical protein